MTAPQVITLGCRLNTFESEIMRQHAEAGSLENAVIINTCAVTAEAERQARQTIRRARRDNPKAKLIVTGCAAQLAPEKFGAMPEVDRVLGNAEKLDPASYGAWAVNAAPVHVTDIMTVHETAPHMVAGFEGRERAFVQVQQGCDHRCTFCIIPFARGPNRSVGMGHLIEQVAKLCDEGYKEIVLTGVDICSYGEDLPGAPRLGHMVTKLLGAVPQLARLRLSSLDPAAMDDALFDLLANEPRLMPHLHLSLQAMDDMVLKRMKRRHSHGDAVRVIERARLARPDVAIGADLIAGFPTETDAMFENTLAAVDGLGLSHLHVFPYSAREGTAAARMPSVPGDVAKARAARLRRAGEKALHDLKLRQTGTAGRVLIERPGEGHSEHYIPVKIDGADDPGRPGQIVDVRITSVTADGLVGVAA
ncbi:MAG: tRNA (N(6)-L-threonylcarbamoyladenosine(37)-C(2))-methylthiotransferase MtaB [Rhodospirillaceae bacterium]|jgi:threonylcarbamoyladenosine tRNA methylthiotransferase MtaB|nr:tRNA (N(6)-L-threonylcarbamoyladenosine(37)-C(2))-methylthiotransferase MtaB [Rhodospirillaceae bacterium]